MTEPVDPTRPAPPPLPGFLRRSFRAAGSLFGIRYLASMEILELDAPYRRPRGQEILLPTGEGPALPAGERPALAAGSPDDRTSEGGATGR